MTDDPSIEAACSLVNQSLETFDCSPVKLVRSDRSVALVKRKIQGVTSEITNAVSAALAECQLTENTNVFDNCMKLVYSIKENLKENSKERKIQLLTLVPDDWSIHWTMEFFKVSEYSVKPTRKLRNERGILATPRKYSREGIDRATKLLITKFYECEAVRI